MTRHIMTPHAVSLNLIPPKARETLRAQFQSDGTVGSQTTLPALMCAYHGHKPQPTGSPKAALNH